jgi:NADPH:quinone reductase
MRAVAITRFGPPDVLEVVARPRPAPGAGQVAIDVNHVGVNFADVMTRRGDYHAAGQPPLVPGLEAAGTVAALGEGVEGLEVGQPVAAFTGGGAYADVVLASAQLTFPIPEGLAFEVAAAVPTIATTALFLVDEVARLRAGETVLVHGAAGGVGSLVGQLVAIRGAALALGTVGSEAKVAYARGCGYTDVVLRDGFVEAVGERTEGRGVDVVLDPIGGDVRAHSMDVLAPLGRLVAFGNASATPETVPEGASLRTANRGVLGFSMGSLVRSEPHRVRAVMGRALTLVADGTLHLDVAEVHDLADATDAHTRLESKATQGKLVLRVRADGREDAR